MSYFCLNHIKLTEMKVRTFSYFVLLFVTNIKIEIKITFLNKPFFFKCFLSEDKLHRRQFPTKSCSIRFIHRSKDNNELEHTQTTRCSWQLGKPLILPYLHLAHFCILLKSSVYCQFACFVAFLWPDPESKAWAY